MSEVYEAMKNRLIEGFIKQAGVSEEVAQGVAEEITVAAMEMDKQANLMSEYLTSAAREAGKAAMSPTLGRLFSESAAKALGTAAVGGLMGAAYFGASKATGAIGSTIESRAFQSAVQKAVASNSILQRADKAKINMLAGSIYKYAPTAAADPNLLSHILTNAVQMESLDIQTIKMLTDLEKVHSGINEPRNTIAGLLRG